MVVGGYGNGDEIGEEGE
ncbi:hypothetical protein A2U01_0114547, partial [Trifolium medium]|nr:hypothetical protein [Trifolium medium]